jgi:hypothetical protein
MDDSVTRSMDPDFVGRDEFVRRSFIRLAVDRVIDRDGILAVSNDDLNRFEAELAMYMSPNLPFYFPRATLERLT